MNYQFGISELNRCEELAERANLFAANMFKKINTVNMLTRQLYGLPARRPVIYDDDEESTVDSDDIHPDLELQYERKRELIELLVLYNFSYRIPRDNMPYVDTDRDFRNDNSNAFLSRLPDYVVRGYLNRINGIFVLAALTVLGAIAHVFNRWLDRVLEPMLDNNLKYEDIRKEVVMRYMNILRVHNLPSVIFDGGFNAYTFPDPMAYIWRYPFPNYGEFAEVVEDLKELIPDIDVLSREWFGVNISDIAEKYKEMAIYEEQGRVILSIYDKDEHDQRWKVPENGEYKFIRPKNDF